MMPFTTFFSQIETMQWYGLGGLVGFPSYICYQCVVYGTPRYMSAAHSTHAWSGSAVAEVATVVLREWLESKEKQESVFNNGCGRDDTAGQSWKWARIMMMSTTAQNISQRKTAQCKIGFILEKVRMIHRVLLMARFESGGVQAMSKNKVNLPSFSQKKISCRSFCSFFNTLGEHWPPTGKTC